MRPAFVSTKHAAAFAALTFAALLSPVIVGQRFLPPRVQAYDAQRQGNSPFPWIRNQIFDEKTDIDIALVGSSHIFTDLNTPYLQEKLSEKLGRPATVRTISWGGAGYETLYFIARDLLAQRKVRMLVFYDENSGIERNPRLPAWFRFNEDAALLSGLPVREQATFYFAAILGMPRNLLCLLRSNRPAPIDDAGNFWPREAGAPNPATRLGSLAISRGFIKDPGSEDAPFTPYAPQTAARSEDALVYSPDTQSNFQFSHAPLPEWQSLFAQRFAALLRAQAVQPVMLYLPALRDAHSPAIPERALWPALLGSDVALLGIPPAKLFGGLTDDETRQLFVNSGHLNRNGQEYLTSLITPALLQIYEKTEHH